MRAFAQIRDTPCAFHDLCNLAPRLFPVSGCGLRNQLLPCLRRSSAACVRVRVWNNAGVVCDTPCNDDVAGSSAAKQNTHAQRSTTPDSWLLGDNSRNYRRRSISCHFRGIDGDTDCVPNCDRSCCCFSACAHAEVMHRDMQLAVHTLLGAAQAVLVGEYAGRLDVLGNVYSRPRYRNRSA